MGNVTVRCQKFATKARARRIKLGISQLELGKQVGLSRFSVIKFEKNGHPPRYDKILKMAKILDLKLPR